MKELIKRMAEIRSRKVELRGVLETEKQTSTLSKRSSESLTRNIPTSKREKRLSRVSARAPFL